MSTENTENNTTEEVVLETSSVEDSPLLTEEMKVRATAYEQSQEASEEMPSVEEWVSEPTKDKKFTKGLPKVDFKKLNFSKKNAVPKEEIQENIPEDAPEPALNLVEDQSQFYEEEGFEEGSAEDIDKSESVRQTLINEGAERGARKVSSLLDALVPRATHYFVKLDEHEFDDPLRKWSATRDKFRLKLQQKNFNDERKLRKITADISPEIERDVKDWLKMQEVEVKPQVGLLVSVLTLGLLLFVATTSIRKENKILVQELREDIAALKKSQEKSQAK